MIKQISEQNVEYDGEEDGEDGESEVVALARRSLQLLGQGEGKGQGEEKGLVEG